MGLCKILETPLSVVEVEEVWHGTKSLHPWIYKDLLINTFRVKSDKTYWPKETSLYEGPKGLKEC